MDPFVFDQKFARFLGQVDRDAMRRGTELYESGAARIDALGKSEIRGSVHERREGAFQVKLLANDAGGLSGSCSCPEFFNCAHSYALARVARDKIVGTASKAKSAAVEKSESVIELERVWKLAINSGFILYPKDLYSLVCDRSSLGVQGREPMRDLKRVLVKENPKTPVAFSTVLTAYFEYKGIQVSPRFEELKSATSVQKPFVSAFKPAEGDRSWDSPPLKLRIRVRLEESSDRDWFQARASWDIEGGVFSDSEIELLRAANGSLVKLEGKGWYRLDKQLPAGESRALHSLGIDPDRCNAQRIHLMQVEELLPEEIVTGLDWKSLRERAKSVKEQMPPEVPEVLSGILRPYQTDGFAYLCQLSRLGFGGILADDMGLGKTLQTLAWLLWLAKEKRASIRVLVVCPKSVIDNWVQEPIKFRTDLTSVRFDSKSEEIEDANILVANYAQLRIHSDYFLGCKWDVVVLDEAQYIKSPTSQTSKVAYKLKATHKLALTGTPIENSLTDLWSVMRFAMPRLLGPLPTFKANYESARGEEALAALRLRMRPFLLRRLKTDVAKDLPDRIEKDVYCDLEDQQRELYEGVLADARAKLKIAKETGEKSSFNVLQALLRLRQICCDPQLLNTEKKEKVEVSAKLQALLDLVEPMVEEGHKVLVFSQFTRMLDIVGSILDEKGISFLKLTGKTKNRGELVERFQKQDSETVFLLSLKAAGAGLTLTAASYVVLLDPWWNPAVEAQAIDRVHRIGQKDNVIAYRILAKDTIEEKIRKIQAEKAELAAALFGERAMGSKVGLEELEALLG